jgi:hypothetical protein
MAVGTNLFPQFFNPFPVDHSHTRKLLPPADSGAGTLNKWSPPNREIQRILAFIRP